MFEVQNEVNPAENDQKELNKDEILLQKQRLFLQYFLGFELPDFKYFRL